jgi:dipeptidyl aminopeptidase/acylaminoacyl peptidase
MKKLFLLAAVIAAALAADAQQQKFELTIDNIMRGPGLVGYEPEEVRWTPDGAKVFFSWKQHDDPQEKDRDTYVVNRDGSGLRKLSEEEKKDAPPANGERTRDKRRIVTTEDGDVYLWDAASGKRRAITRTTDAESAPHFTFDEKRVTFVRGNNVFAVDLSSGETTQLTNVAGLEDKGPNVTLWDEKKGTDSQEYVKKEEKQLFDVVARRAKKREEDEAKKKREHPLKPFKLAKGQSVSDGRLTPDGKYVVVVVTTEPEKGKRTIVPNYVTESAYVETIPGREKVGDVQMSSRIAVLSEINGESKWFEHGMTVTPPEKPQPVLTGAPQEREGRGSAQKTEKSEGTQRESAKTNEREVSLRAPVWSEDGKHAFVVVRSTDTKDLWIMAFDPAAPKGRTIVSLHDDAWIRWAERSLEPGWAGNETIFYASEATGFMHLYSVPFAGGAPKQLTSGEFEVDSVELSNDKESFYLITSEASPFERHLYRMPVAGGARTKLTSMTGENQAVVAPDGGAIANVYSYTNKPPELYIDGKRITTSPAPEFASYPWLDVPIVRVPARDKTQLPARIYEPSTPNGAAVVFVHGAGYLQNVTRSWSSYYREYMFHHVLMARGYTVLDVDYRASRGYGRNWRTAIYRHMGGVDLDDQIDAARWLVREKKIDPKRIGVYGGSYGGFITLMAMFTQPDVFAAGAALRPVTDWAHYNHPYTANILNLPQSDSDAYRKSSPIYFAQGLKGRLLICHGMVDTNVHFEDSVRLVQKLIELRKTNWELAVFPVENHGFVEPTSWADEYKRIYKLFEETIGR